MNPTIALGIFLTGFGVGGAFCAAVGYFAGVTRDASRVAGVARPRYRRVSQYVTPEK